MNEVSVSNAKKNPVFKIVSGRVNIAVWSNPTTKGEIFSVTAIRSYKSGNDWKESHSFGVVELPGLVKALEEAYAFIRNRLVANKTVGA